MSHLLFTFCANFKQPIHIPYPIHSLFTANLKMKAACLSGTLVSTNITIQHHNLEELKQFQNVPKKINNEQNLP